MTRAELKDRAKAQLRGNWGWAICLFLIGAIIIGILTSVNTIWGEAVSKQRDITNISQVLFDQGAGAYNLVVGIFTTMIGWGVTYTVLNFADTANKEQVFKGVFSGFTDGRFKNTFLTALLQEVFLTLWTCLLIIPGWIKGYSYAMAPYIMKDMFDAGHEMKATEAITESRKLMNGHKAELFLLDVSFWGWDIVGLITGGIGFLWITPYYRQTKANFYRQLAGDRYLQK